MHKIYRMLLSISTLSICSVSNAAIQCPLTIQIGNYSPSVCYINSSLPDCVDTCSAALPQGTPSCFREMALPCDLVKQLHRASDSYQELAGRRWIHISDLIDFPALRDDLYVLRSDLYSQLYGHYVSPPSYRVFSVSVQQIQKDNFRLFLIEELRALLDPLKFSALYKRLTFGQAIEHSIKEDFGSLLDRIDNFPLYNSLEKTGLVSELNLIKNSELFLWEFMGMFDRELIASSRATYINSLLNDLAGLIASMDDEERSYVVGKLEASSAFNDIEIRACNDSICYKDIVPNEYFFQDIDPYLAYLEEHLNMAIAEASLIVNSIGADLVLRDPTDLAYPNFASITSPMINHYIANPSIEKLKQLEVAINVAYLQKDSDGQEVFKRLQESAHKEVVGSSYLEPLENRRTLLCKDLHRLKPELKALQDTSFSLAAESHDIIAQISGGKRTDEMMGRMQKISKQITELDAEVRRISSVDRFTMDRNIQVFWNLDYWSNSFDAEPYAVQLEYVAFDGLYWTPSDSFPIQLAIPSIREISTVKGSLLPSGNGKMTAMNTLKMTVSQSPYTGCAAGNKDIYIVAQITDSNDQVKRVVLKAEVEQY